MADKILRCAVYTRKSTEDGLEQEFNSLDAQYEACTAYAVSQRHEGWVLVPDRYDDGGFSGGNMQRAGLTRLLADVAAGKVDIILIYKIDRLTRSLADFAKIVEVLDKAKASFVSITQSFNTTTSMGRLTLNMLLSFAQFEREVTGERIRDKIAASKRKGIWMGGTVPLGYDVEDRRLITNEVEADLVQTIYRRYLVLPSVVELADELNRQGHRTKIQNNASGPHRGGCTFQRGTLYHMLANRIYIGELGHKGVFFPAEHPAIVPPDLWAAVQAKLKANAQGTSRRIRAGQPSLLAGFIFDGEGRAMTPSHATKPGKRYRYYITRPELLDGSPAWRLSAPDVEKMVCERLSDFLSDAHGLCALAPNASADETQRMLARADIMAAAMRSGSAHARIELLGQLVRRVALIDDRIDLTISAVKLGHALEFPQRSDTEGNRQDETITLSMPVAKVRRGHQLRLVIPGPAAPKVEPARRDARLVALLADAMAARNLVIANPDKSLNALASAHGKCRTRLGKLIALSCLAPDIVSAIIEGRQPVSLTSRALMDSDMPTQWAVQRTRFGLA
ncbi:recombinase family protein [Novosphingobium sp.]|uniref:recombinase family protein n=1 Tax=Novosphingobium sp. TaxID=1874826 RepID=UPI003D0D10C8